MLVTEVASLGDVPAAKEFSNQTKPAAKKIEKALPKEEKKELKKNGQDEKNGRPKPGYYRLALRSQPPL